MAILGAHQSIAGGHYKAVERTAQRGCDCVQLFLKNNSQWAAKDISPEQARRFREALKTSNVGYPIAHDSYLINLASPDRRLWRRSVDALVAELHRAEVLGIDYVITHPGAFTSASEAAGLGNVVRAVDAIHAQSRSFGRGVYWRPRPGKARRSAGDLNSLPRSSTASKTRAAWASVSTPVMYSPPDMDWARRESTKPR